MLRLRKQIPEFRPTRSSLFAVALIFLSSLAVSATGQNLEAGSGISAFDAFARVNSPTSKVGSAYMTIANLGDAADRLMAVSSAAAARIELHDIDESESGVVRMVRIDGGVDLPAGETVRFNRGGRHLMLMGLERSLGEGDEFDITLMFEIAEPVEVTVRVDLSR